MIPTLLLGISAGMRSMTPLAITSAAIGRGGMPVTGRAGLLLAHPVLRVAAAVLAVGEAFGDKLRSAPDRIVAPGLAARLATGALVGAAAAPRDRQAQGALLGAAAAIGFAYLSFAARERAMRRFGQEPTGLLEDGLAAGLALLAVAPRPADRERAGPRP